MVIVFDLQTSQLLGYEKDEGCQALTLALALLKCPGAHSLRILLNGSLPRAGELRERFAPFLAAEHIRVFDPVVPANGSRAAHADRRQANRLIREYTIAQLHAQAVIVGLPFAGWEDESVFSIISGVAHVVLVAQAECGASAGTPSAAFFDARLAELADVKILLTLSAAAHVFAEANLDRDRIRQFEAAQAHAVARELLDHLAPALPPTPTQRHRRKLAFITPLPPERTGIADYAVQLLPAMLDDFDITLVVQQDEVNLPPALNALPRRDTAWLAEHAEEFDQLLYQFGNSPFHSDMFGLLSRHPGVVVLHDFFLSSVLAYEQMTGGIPNAWSDALFHSHGLGALRASQQASNHAAAMNDYPCSLGVVEGATRVIVHSEYARQLAEKWYGPRATDNWSVVPLPRAAPALIDRSAAREALGIAENTFLVCSFGYVGPTKLSDALVRAWLASSLHTDADCLLTLVGACPPGDFGQQLLDLIDDSSAQRTVRITGWADEASYHLYLQAADLSVQLRTTSRGETSAAVLDAMNYGLATIVNANGSMAALSPEGVWMLPDQFDLPLLVDALETLRHDVPRRQRLGERARDILRSQHRPDHCAALYREALDLALTERASQLPALLDALSALPGLREDEPALRMVANAVARAPNATAPRQLLVDVSTIVQHDLRTGIERVVRTQLLELLQLQQCGLRVEPIFLSAVGGFWHYRYARRYALDLLGMTAPGLPDAPIDFQPGDIFYCADYAPAAIVEAAKAGVYAHLSARGVSMNFLIYDLLPVLRPEFFPANAEQVHAQWLRCIAAYADRLLCISAAVADEARLWLASQADLPPRPLTFVPLHLGADIDIGGAPGSASRPTADIASALAARPSFLMVGTVEPRKGHLQALAAFELLWDAGEQVNLVIVGNEGWRGLSDAERRTIPEIMRRLRGHPEANKRLLWLEGIDDTVLETIYRNSTCLLAPSEGEGFGLPLIEAARYGLPILARDIAVFREVAGQHASYFSGMAPRNLAAAVQDWLQLRSTASVPASGAMAWRTWRENAVQLLEILDNGDLSQASSVTPDDKFDAAA